jgi:alpha-tubulin suppressor-like RCC1 family protein
MHILRRHLSELFLGAALALGATTAPAAEPNAIRQVSLGAGHACVLTYAGSALCWGDNKFGQIGNGLLASVSPQPTLVIDGGVSAVSAGYAHTCAVVAGALQCWGWNLAGQLGAGQAGANQALPTLVIREGVSAVSAGGMHTCAVVAGALQCWGYNASGQIGTEGPHRKRLHVFKPTPVIAAGVTGVSAGSQHTCAIVAGALRCWGDNRNGQIGSGDATAAAVPEPMTVIEGGVTAVAAALDYTCAVANGALLCWGKIDEAGIGPNAKSRVLRPRLVIESGVTAVATGAAHICAVVRGALQCWGYNSDGGVGTGKTAEVVPSPRVVIASGVTAVAASEFNTCVLVDGALRCRGSRPGPWIAERAMHHYQAFGLAGGDVAGMDMSAAAAAAEMVKAPERIAAHMKGRLIRDGQAAYVVSEARAMLNINLELVLQLDVSPLVNIDSSGVSDDACGLNLSALPTRLTSTRLLLLEGGRFVNLKDALRPVFPALPAMATPSLPALSERDIGRVRACGERVLAAAAALPFASIKTGAGLPIPWTLDGRWAQAPSQYAGPADHLFVQPRAGNTGRFTAEVDLVSALQCGETRLAQWRERKSAPWLLPAKGNRFAIDRKVLDVDVPEFAAYTEDELKQALSAARQPSGLATPEDAAACQRVVTGERYRVRYDGKVVQEFALAYPQARPVGAVACTDSLPTRALHVARELGYPVMDSVRIARCKPWPGDSARSIVALAFASPQEVGSPDAEAGDFDLDVLVVQSDSGDVVGRLRKDRALPAEEWPLEDLRIDTAAYALAPGLRAFAVRAHRSGSMRSYSGASETLGLYLADGKELKQVLGGLVVAESNGGGEEECEGRSSETSRTLSVAKSSSHGLADLIVNSIHLERKCGSSRAVRKTTHHVLRFDGTQYVLPKALRGD